MEIRYNIEKSQRKALAQKVAEIIGAEVEYLGVPSCAYQIDIFTLSKDAILSFTDRSDSEIVEKVLDGLADAGYSGETITYPEGAEHDEDTEPEDADEDEAETDVDIEPEDADEDDAETDEDTEPEDADEDEAETDEDTEAEDANEEEAENDEDTEPDDADEDAEPDEDTEPEDADEDDAETDEDTEPEDADEDAEPDNGFPLRTEISLPLANHTVQSLKNLICMIHARGALLSKATCGAFAADKSLVDEIGGHEFRSTYELIVFIREWEETNPELKGIRFADDKLIFDGFGEAPDADHVQAFTNLAAAMNSMALTQKRVQAKDVDDSNEKYAMRVWLVRIGFGGADHKTDRRILLEHLTGHTAFRNDEEKAKWTERQKAKREAAKAAAHTTEEEENDAVSE